MPKRIINPSYWSQLPTDNITKGFSAKKKNVLISQFSVLGVFLTFLHILLDLGLQKFNYIPYDLVICITFLVIYKVNESGRHTFAKVLLISSMNVEIMAYALFIPEKASVILFYFPMLCGSIIGIGRGKHLQRMLILSVPILLFTWCIWNLDLVFLTDTNLSKIYSTINTLLTSVTLAMIVKLLADINFKTESRLKEEEEKQKALAQDLIDKNNALEKANNELDKFVYSASHDLRAPLTSLLGLIQLAEHEFKTDTNALEYFNKMRYSVNKLDDFIKDILDYSRNTKLEITKEPIDFEQLWHEIIDSLKYTENVEQIDFKKDLTSTSFHTDAKRLKVILNNLISNSIKYHDYTKQSLYIETTITKNEEGLKISVKDNGIGIAENEQENVFKMFHRAAETSEGSGLGLYIVKETVEMLGGNITLASEYGEWTEITIQIPHHQNQE